MSNLSDSELIALYHEGKLDGESMNMLERRALDDPFLADALEGFSRTRRSRVVIKKDLKERLYKRLHKNKRRSIIGQTASWAAAAAIVLAVGATWFWFHEEKENRLVSADAKTTLPPPAAENDTIKEAPPAEAPKIAAASAAPEKPVIKAASPKEAAASVKPLPDSVILGDVASVSFARAPAKKTFGARPNAEGLNRMPTGGHAEGRLAGSSSSIKNDLNRKNDSLQKQLSESSYALAIKKQADAGHMVKGRVVDVSDGAPLPGVNLVLRGKNTGVVTNAQGEFSLPADSGDVVDAKYIGFQSAQKSVTKTDSLIIAMQPADQSLNEVVVVGYGTQKATRKTKPVGGWKAYREYLEEETGRTSRGSGGRVVMEFTINETGEPTEFLVIKSASAELAQRAKDILANGPKWKGGTAVNERIRISLKVK